VKRFLIPLTLAAAALTVFAYNYQGYCRGRCTLQGFGLFGPFERSMLLLFPFLLLLIGILKVRQCRRHAASRCSCGAGLAEDWRYCPVCGAPRQGSSIPPFGRIP